MAERDDGGPAFPTEVLQSKDREGMTLRDWFAGMCLSGQLAHPKNEGVQYSEFAHDAYRMADAMLAERRK